MAAHNRFRPTVFIDWYLTLSQSVYWEQLAAQDTERYEALGSTLFVKLRPYHAGWMRGEWTSEHIMARVSEITGLDFKFVFDEFVRSCEAMRFADPEIPNLIARLRQRGQWVCVATDNMDVFSRFTAPAMHLLDHFDDVLNSWEIKALKDDIDADGRSLFFQDYLTRHKLVPDHCVLIDDSLETAETCGKIGMAYRLVTTERPLVQHLCGLLEI